MRTNYILKRNMKRVLFTVAVLLVVVVSLFPIYWVILTSFKYQRDFMSSPPVYFTTALTLEHYITAFKMWNTGPYIIHSLVISLIATFLIVLLSVPAAYAISKYQIGGAKLNTWMVFQRMLPPAVVIIPVYLIFSKLNILDTYIGMALPYLIFQIPFAILMLIGFFSDIHQSLQEAAMVDGCTEIQSLVILFSFVFVWNDMLIALALSRQNTQTIVMLVAASMQQLTGTFFGMAAAMASFAIIPIFVITIFTQKHLVRGMTMGGVKG